MHLRKTHIAAAILSALVSSTAFADVKIAVIAPLTGGSQGMGLATKAGAELAVAEINAAGGLLGGQKITLLSYDEKGRVELGEQLSKEAIEKGKAVAAIGLANTNVAARAIPVFQRAGIPIIITSAPGTVLTQMYRDMPIHYIFRNAAYDYLQSDVLAKYAVEVRGIKRPAVFADNTAYGDQGVQQLMAHFDKYGARPVLVERFPLGKTEFEDSTNKARHLGVDSIITWALATESAAIKTSFNRMGLRLPVFGSWALSQTTYTYGAGGVANGSIMPLTFSSDTEREAGQRFIKNYRNMHNNSTISSEMSAAQAYDAVYILAKAITQAKTTEPKRIVAALENLEGSYEGALMTYEKPYSKAIHDTFVKTDQLYIGIVRNGRAVRLK